MSNYFGYTKIPLGSAEWANAKISKQTKWIVTEKVHGACFCFVYDVKTKQTKYAKRRQFIADDEVFFGYKEMLPEVLPKINVVQNEVLKMFPNAAKIHVYGELFGGTYPSMTFKFKPVQSGIYYSPNLHFYAFDISVCINISETMTETYLNFCDSLKIFRHAKILHAEPLEIFNSYEKAIEYPIYFNTKIPAKLGLELLEISVNNAEGIVIRSSIGRFCVKKKIKEFSESCYNENNYENNDNSLSPLDKLKNQASQHIAQNRLNNAISKIGSFDKNKDDILEEFVYDILLEINCFHEQELIEWLNKQIKEFIDKNQQTI